MVVTVVLLMIACHGAPSESQADDSRERADSGADDDSGIDSGIHDDSGTSVTPMDPDGDGWSAESGDCAPDDASVSPDAFEVPLNGVDENCDASDAGPVIRLDSTGSFTSDVATGRAGDALAVADIDVDGAPDWLVGASGFGTGYLDGTAVGLPWVKDSEALDLSDSIAVISGVDEGGNLGWQMVAAQLTEGEEVLLLSAPNADSVYGFALPIDGSSSVAGALITIAGPYSSYLGTCLSAVGDLDGDGFDEVLVTSTGGGGEDPATVYSVTGPLSGVNDIADAAQAAIFEDDTSDGLGVSLAAIGDTTGDGESDVIVGAPSQSADAPHAGRAYILPGPLQGDAAVSDMSTATVTVGDAGVTYLGYWVASAGDFNGDEFEDVLVTAALDSSSYERGGSVYFFAGPLSGVISVTDADASFHAETENEWLGYRAAGVGDWDGDGDSEVVVSAPRDYYFGGEFPGKAYLITGPFQGSLGLEHVELVWAGERPGDFTGASILSLPTSVVGARRGVAIGSPGYDGVVEDGGRAYVRYNED